MNSFRIALQCAVLALAGLSTVAAQRAGMNKTAVNETQIEDLDELDPPFKAWTGIDYGPFQVPAPKVKIVNMTGIFVETPLECAVRCTDEKLCNAASFYGDNPVGSWPSGITCWLKTISVPCKLPADYEVAEFPDTIFLLAQEEECEEEDGPSLLTPLIAGAPEPGESPEMAELEDDPLLAPMEDYPMMAPMQEGPMMAPGEEGPMMGPAEGPLATAPFGDSPAAAAPPPAAPAVSTGGLITDFQVGTAPPGTDSAPPDRPTPSATPSPLDPPSAIAPAPGPEDVDNFPEAFSPQSAFSLDREAAGAAGMRAGVAAAAVAAVFCLMA